MKRLRGLLHGLLRALLAAALGLGLIVLGNVFTAWLLFQPPPDLPLEPRAWTWDPFANQLRLT